MNKREQVLNDIQIVLEKHNASISVEDFYDGYPECGQDLKIIIEVEGENDIEIGSCFDHLTNWDCLSK